MEQMTPEWKDFLQACIQGATTRRQYSKLNIRKQTEKLLVTFDVKNCHNNNDNTCKSPKTGMNRMKYHIKILTFADKIDRRYF